MCFSMFVSVYLSNSLCVSLYVLLYVPLCCLSHCVFLCVSLFSLREPLSLSSPRVPLSYPPRIFCGKELAKVRIALMEMFQNFITIDPLRTERNNTKNVPKDPLGAAWVFLVAPGKPQAAPKIGPQRAPFFVATFGITGGDLSWNPSGPSSGPLGAFVGSLGNSWDLPAAAFLWPSWGLWGHSSKRAPMKAREALQTNNKSSRQRENRFEKAFRTPKRTTKHFEKLKKTMAKF